MKVIIDLPKSKYEELQNNKHHPNRLSIERAITKGIVLPDNATNGDVIKALFPNIEKDNERLIQAYGSQALYDTYEKWCELPYKVGDTDG